MKPQRNFKWNPKEILNETLKNPIEHFELLIRNPDKRHYMKPERHLNETLKKPEP